MDFPDLFSPFQRRLGWILDGLVRAWRLLFIRWLAEDRTKVGLANHQA